LTSPATIERVKKLEENGIIGGYRAGHKYRESRAAGTCVYSRQNRQQRGRIACQLLP
jgi:DNA-binding Lrp family transcriptional regulator